MTAAQEPPTRLLFQEAGAGWWWVLAGPAASASLIYIQHLNHVPISLLVPTIFLVLITAFVALQVKAARIHTSVELTEDALRQGTETILIREIVKVYPEAENSVKSDKPLANWQEARALGELTGVPRGRYGIGLRLTGNRTAQAWARRHRHLRDALVPLIEQRTASVAELVEDIDDDDNESIL